MGKAYAIALAILATVPVTALYAQSATDSAAIAATAHDYIDGWWSGDAARMQRSLHNHLAKRMVMTDSSGQHSRLVDMTALELVQGTERGGGKQTPADKRKSDVRILDIFQNAALVRIDAGLWIDYLEEVRWNGEWKILNVVWEPRQR
ncbi:MAG: nuclear transport factor 2 family protein [Gemmatimonadota bacterium]